MIEVMSSKKFTHKVGILIFGGWKKKFCLPFFSSSFYSFPIYFPLSLSLLLLLIFLLFHLFPSLYMFYCFISTSLFAFYMYYWC